MQIKMFNSQIRNDSDLKVFENAINTFIEREINLKNKVVYDIRQTEVPFGTGNNIVTMLTVMLSYEDSQK